MSMMRMPPIDDVSYPPPRGYVLLLSCMDLRLLDDITRFMDHDNLVNRYDHVVFAGAALGALGAPGAKDEDGCPIDCSHWKRTFEDHLNAAVDLHQVEDVYILEHRHCGAYHKVFHICPDFGDTPAERRKEERCHLNYARQLERVIADWAKQKGVTLRTHRFLMDIRGRVSVLPVPARKPPRR
jgi:hypothetical protein